jgi:hypothetical protein
VLPSVRKILEEGNGYLRMKGERRGSRTGDRYHGLELVRVMLSVSEEHDAVVC